MAYVDNSSIDAGVAAGAAKIPGRPNLTATSNRQAAQRNRASSSNGLYNSFRSAAAPHLEGLSNNWNAATAASASWFARVLHEMNGNDWVDAELEF